MQLRVLGEVELLVDGDPVPVGSRNQRVVLAVLAARPDVTTPADVLVEAIWGDEQPPSALRSLRTYVSRLRRSLGDHLAIGPAGYHLDVPAGGTDAGRFEQLVDRAAAVDGDTAIAILDEALALWRGAPFGDLADLTAVRSTAARLEERRTAAQEDRARALLAAGHPARAGSAAEELVADHPLREGAWAVLVEALVATDRTGEALRAYQRASRVLAGAGLEPSPRLRRAESAALARREPEVAPRPVAPAIGISSFVGRDADVAALRGLLARHRMVTLVGPGGVGKTRLARAVAAAVGDRHRWGSREVALAGVSDPGTVLDVVAGDLGLSVEAGDPARSLVQAGNLDLLVVIDCCEHVVEAAARAVEALHKGGSRVRVLATSRQPLGVDGEHLWPVEPLAAGPRGTPAHDLFLDRARAVRPGLEPDAIEETTIGRITRRLDGLPLAVEMAATLVATMPIAELARRLDDQLDLLVSRRRTAEARHRTLAAVVTWSEQLLDREERHLFADMAVFEGAVSPADVATVTGHPDPLPVLARLAERSLLVPSTAGREARFRMLHTIREQAARTLERTGRRAELDRRHAEHVADALARADRGLRSPAEPEAHERVEELLGDARAAHAWASARDRALARRLCGAVFLFAQSRRRDELLGWSTALLPDLDPVADPAGAASVLLAAAQRDVDRGGLEGAIGLADRAAGLASDPGIRALAHEVASDVHLFSGRLGEATVHARAGLAAATEAGEVHGMVVNRINLALAAAYGGDRRRGIELLDGAPGEPGLGPSDRAWLAYGRGEVVLDHDPEVALEALERAVTLADSVGNRYVSGVARVSATSLRARAGDAEASLAPFAAVIEHWRGLGDRLHLLTTLRNLVVLFQRMDAAAETAELLGAVSGNAVAPTFGEEAERLAGAGTWATRALGRREVELHLATGARRTVDEAARATLDQIAALQGVPDRSA